MLRPILIAAVLGLATAAAAQPPGGPAVPASGATRPATPPLPACDTRRFNVVGLPRLRSEEGRFEQIGPLCDLGRVSSFNWKTNSPDWVIERLTRAALVGPAARKDNFAQDPRAPGSPGPDDYHGERDRGHQAPAGDDKFSQAAMDGTFKMTNMSPQVGIGFNRGQWKYLEEAVRSWVLCGGHDDVVVITGPIYGDSRQFITGGRILIPEAYYKIVYDVQTGRAVGFRLPNQKTARTDLGKFVVPITRIEDETGIDFFPRFSLKRQQATESSKGLVWGHAQACAGLAPE